MIKQGSDDAAGSTSKPLSRDESTACAHSANGNDRHISRSLYFAFFLSGFSALVYQTAWQRMLGLFGGSDAIAATLVVGSFLFGLGIGSLWAASFADRQSARQAIQVFALCEFGIAAFAMSSRLLFYDLLFGHSVVLARSQTTLLATVFVVLLPPTILMGMSLPLLSRAIVVRIETASRQIGWLYGVNTLGAAVGALLAGFYVIGTFGYEVAVYLGALLNLLVGVSALFTASRLRGEPIRQLETTATVAPRLIPPRIWYWSALVFVSGFLIISLEIVWFRVLGLLMQTNAYAFSLVLTVFLAGDALGIVYGARVVRDVADPLRLFRWLQGAMALYALVSLGVISVAHGWLDLSPWFVDAAPYGVVGPGWGIVQRLVVNFSVAVFLVLPPAVLLGMSFPMAQRAVQDDQALIGQRVGLIQLFNILGNSLGAIVTGLVLLHWLGTAGTLRLIGTVGLLFVFALLWELPHKRELFAATPWVVRRSGATALAALLAITVVLFPNNAKFWLQIHGASQNAGSLVSEDRTGVAVMRSHDQDNHVLYIGGHSQSQVPFTAVHGALGVIGALVHPQPRAILVVGLGAGGSPYASGVNPATDRIRVVEIVEPVFSVMQQFAEEHRGSIVNRVFSDPRFERIVADARHLLFTNSDRYDVVQADAVYPWSSHAGLLYSAEFFQQVRERLNDGGIFVLWMPTERTLATFLSVFPHVVRVNSALLGSDRPIPFVLDDVAERLRGPVRPYLVAAGWDPDVLVSWFSAAPVETWDPIRPRESTDVNTDLFPKDEYYLNKRKIVLLPNVARTGFMNSAAGDRPLSLHP